MNIGAMIRVSFLLLETVIFVVYLGPSAGLGHEYGHCQTFESCATEIRLCSLPYLVIPPRWRYHCRSLKDGSCKRLCTGGAPSKNLKQSSKPSTSSSVHPPPPSSRNAFCPCKKALIRNCTLSNRAVSYNLSDPVSKEKFKKRLIEIKANLTVNKKKLTRFKNTKLSGLDNRMSATATGLVGVIVLVSTTLFIAVPDLKLLCFFVLRKIWEK